VQRNEYLAAKAKDFVRANPFAAMDLSARKVVRTWSPMPLSPDFARPAYLTVGLCFALPFFLIFILGLRSDLLPGPAKVFLAAPAIYLTLAAALSVGSLRYRIPAEVPMAVVASAGLSIGLNRQVGPRYAGEQRRD
jgi:hypothetical protein